MPKRLAAILALIVFAACLVIGGLQADNTFSTTVWRALVAMFGTFVIGLVLGVMGKKMLEDNLMAEEKKLKESPNAVESQDR